MGLTARARWSFARSCAAASSSRSWQRCRPVRWPWRRVRAPTTGGREIAKLGHTVRLIAPAYVKPFVKRQKNDMADAEAICEAAQRPTMRFVALKSANQQANHALRFADRAMLIQAGSCIAGGGIPTRADHHALAQSR